jgi:KDO2-lipid IV(A) lauroyltransferase
MSTEVPADNSQPLHAFWQPRYWGIWVCLGLLRINSLLPYRVQMAEGRALGRLLYHSLPGRRRVAAANLALCFPDTTPAAREQLLRRHFASLGMTVIEHALAWTCAALKTWSGRWPGAAA